MPYNLSYKHIQTFLQIVETHNVTEAATLMHISQPAVTKQIKNLESETGKRLFYFDGKRTLLTTDGEKLLPYAIDIQKSFRQLVEHLSDENQDYRLKLVTSPIFDEWIIQILKKVKRLYPKLHYDINITTNDHTAIYEYNNSNLIISAKAIADKKYYCEKISHLDCILLASPENLDLLKNLTITEIFAQTFITLKLHSLLYDATMQTIPKHSKVSIFSNAQVAKKAIIANLGIGWLPKLLVQKELTNGQLISLNELITKTDDEELSACIEIPGIDVHLAYHHEHPNNKVIQKFINELRVISKQDDSLTHHK